MVEMQKSKPSHENTFYISVCLILAKILVIKTSHMLSPKSRGREVYSMSGAESGVGTAKSEGTGNEYGGGGNWESNLICRALTLKCTGTISDFS